VGAKASAYNLVLQNLSHKSPTLYDHLVKMTEHEPDLYLGDVFVGFFTRHLALDEVTRLWDVYVFEGDAVLVRACVALLLEREISLLGAKTVAEVVAVMEQSSHGGKFQPVIGGSGNEDRWMRAVRHAGKA
jgi:hypothetical protein